MGPEGTSSEASSSAATAEPALPASLRLGPVHLTVTDLERSVAFYQDAIGLQVQRREDGAAELGAGDEALLVLVEEPAARPAGRHAGLYHFALLFDSGEELAHALLRLAATRTAIDGASDHGVSEAIYLSDPDGNGIELYADRPRGQWPPPQGPDARVGMYTVALDLDAVLAAAGDEPPRRHAGAGLTVGHVHLHVNDLATARSFYLRVLGFEQMASYPGAAFLSAGGYHHHLGVNVWRGEGIPAAPADGVVGLRHWTVFLESPEQVAEVRRRAQAAGSDSSDHPDGFLVRDPAGIPVAFATAPADDARADGTAPPPAPVG